MHRLTRRHALTSAAGATAAAALPADAVAQALTDLVRITPGPALEPELVTVTDTAMAAWWRTDRPADTTVVLEALDGPEAGQVRELRLEEGRTVHAARVEGLRPGTRYRYELRSGGQRVSLGPATEADPGEFRTLVPPPGPLLARIALLNDIHVGEQVSGQLVGTPAGSLPPAYTGDDYAFRMLQAAVGELRDRPIDLVIANGDLTDRGREDEVRRALAGLRELPFPLLVTRGNHDRRLEGACAADGDCLRVQAFGGQGEGDHVLRSVARVGPRVAVVGLDSCDPTSGDGRLDLGGQAAWLEEQLVALRREGRETIVAFHHPILRETDPPSFSDGVDAGGAEVLAVLGRHEHVRLVVSGHSHRNNLGFDPAIGQRLPFLENGATKEYPAGFALLDVFEGGIMRTFHRPVTDFSREWVRTSAQQIFGFHPTVTRGSLASRAFVTGFASPTLATAQVAPPRTGLRVRALRRRGLGRFLERGLPVDVRVDGARTVVRVQLVAGFGRGSDALLVATGRRRGSGRVRLRAPRPVRRALRRRGRTVPAVLVVRAQGQVVRRAVRLTVR
jgi:predicted phosphohydrolase